MRELKKITREEAERLIKESAEKNKIKTSSKREIKKRVIKDIDELNINEEYQQLHELISNPESIQNLTEEFDKKMSNSSPWFQEQWEKQKENGSIIDEMLIEFSNKFDDVLNEDGSIVNAFSNIITYLEKLTNILCAIEPYLDAEISTCQEYDKIKTHYQKIFVRTNDSIEDCKNLIDDIFSSKDIESRLI